MCSIWMANPLREMTQENITSGSTRTGYSATLHSQPVTQGVLRHEKSYTMKHVLAVSSLILVSLWWSSGIANDIEASETSEYIEAQHEFMKLKSKWAREKAKATLSSRTTDYWKGAAGQSIIAMGKRALPFVMEEISRGDFFFNIPAWKITNITTPNGIKRESEQELSRDWIEWWRKNKDNPEWNVYINKSKNAEHANSADR